MTSTTLLRTGRNPNLELLILTVAGLLMAVMMGLPSMGMFNFLTAHGVIDGSDFYAYLGLVDMQVLNSTVWMAAAAYVSTKHDWPPKTDAALLGFTQWPLGHQIVMGFFFASSMAWIIQGTKWILWPHTGVMP